MGTNYYRRKIATEEDKQKMIDLIKHNQIEELALFVNNINTEIHICKCSYGWKTLWDHNWCEYYDMNKESLKKFLNEPNTYIVNEYDRKYSYEEFWKMIIERDNNPFNKFTAESYDEYERSEGKVVSNADINSYKAEFKLRLGLEAKNSDYISDGLRFSIFTDFC